MADTKVRKKEFYTSVRIAVGFLTAIPYYLLLLLAAVLSGNPAWIALALGLPLFGWFAELYRDAWQRWLAARKALRHPQRQALLHAREQIGYDFREIA
jgi:hypothetical protein